MYIPFLIILGYMVLLVVIAVLSNQYFRKKGSAAEFLLAGKSLPTFLVMAMVAGTAITKAIGYTLRKRPTDKA